MSFLLIRYSINRRAAFLLLLFLLLFLFFRLFSLLFCLEDMHGMTEYNVEDEKNPQKKIPKQNKRRKTREQKIVEFLLHGTRCCSYTVVLKFGFLRLLALALCVRMCDTRKEEKNESRIYYENKMKWNEIVSIYRFLLLFTFPNTLLCLNMYKSLQ